MSLQIRAEFTNVFNRTQFGNPSTTAPAAPPTKTNGVYSGGFGTINEFVSGPRVQPSQTLNAVVGQLYSLPRSGTLIARFSF
jgi:hypothetical protein